jgi:DNA primase
MGATTDRRHEVGALKRDRPVAEVIAGYGIALRPSGRALTGRCPFHADGGRPNLYVYPDNGSWHCYRCAAGGDVISFVMRHDRLDFAGACERLAGLPQPAPRVPTAPADVAQRGRWERLSLDEQVVLNTAGTLYQHALWRDPRALAYVRGRGLPDWTIRQCALGYADGHSLEAYLRRRSGLRVAEELGLLRRPAREDGSRPLRETFAGRIVVPELRGGHCIWFIGRALAETPGRPKYLALAGERPVLGWERAAGRREAFLCEGVFDYLLAVSWRLPAFSPCGTHLPADRLGFLARATAVYGVLDGDEAGREASARFGAVLGERWRPLRLPAGCDLNDLGRRLGGRAEFFRLLAAARRAGQPVRQEGPAGRTHDP